MKSSTSPTIRILAVIALAWAWPLHALQGGNVMPEYVQFTPAESPDMVSLGTGNFTYSLPLGEVPGPYGSYPLSMSYQPGIGPNQEATWVGLGWTLNPGAINRNVRGAPDDQFHGGELAFLYSYSKSSNWGVGVGYTNGVFSLNMSYSSTGGYGITAGYGFNIGIINMGASFGNDGVGLDAGVGVKGVGVNGGINFGADGYQGSSLGLTVSGNANGGKGTITASIGVHHTAGRGTSFQAGMGYAPKAGSGQRMGPQGPKTSGFTITDGSLSLKAGGVGTTVSLPSSGIGVASSNGASSSDANTASFALVVPIPNVGIFSFGYSRSIYESWVRQATSEYLYGYMYQGGPAIMADARTDEMNIGGTSGTGASAAWNWNFKGKSLDRVGNPISGDLLPAYDLYSVAANGVSGTFRPYGLTRHSLYQSVEELNPDDQAAQALYYLMKEDAANNKQYDAEFPANPSTAAGSPDFSRYAYDYCYDQATGASSYNGMDNVGKLNEVIAGRCSRYAILKSRHLNEGNRMVALADLETPRNIRSRMMFRFMGETGGNFTSEDPEWKPTKYNQFELASATFQRDVNGVNRGLFGSRRIDPILENNRNNGRLQGFRIINPDGSQYFFTQPVRAIISADYTTNRAKGAPLFVDKHSAAANDDFIDLIGNAFMDFINFSGNLVDDPLEALDDLAGWTESVLTFPGKAIKSFFWSSPKFKDVCQQAPDEQYNFSYSMKINPHATQWLLTEVRGPEFVLLDRNDMTKNIGYQVKFTYATPYWYKWRFPFAAPNTHKDELPNFRVAKNAVTPENCHSDLFHGSFGVKEIVYLSRIETASHKADFVLNDPNLKPRMDGKGWIQDWTGRTQAAVQRGGGTPSKTAMPIYVDAQMEMTASRVPNQRWQKKCVDHFNVSQARQGQTCWWEANLNYAVSAAYLNMMPTQQQIDRMVNKRLLFGGMTNSASLIHTGPGGKQVGNGFVYKGFASQNLAFADGSKPVLASVTQVSGKALALGSTRLDFAAAVPMEVAPYNSGTVTESYPNVYRVGMRSCSTPAASCTVTIPTTDTLNVTIPGTLVVGGPSGTLIRPQILQPLMVFNDFVETSGPEDNMLRYLDAINIVEKSNNSAMRQYRFSYDYEIQPGTLNSYDVRRNPDGSMYRDADGMPDLAYNYPKAASPTMEELEGKLKLKSVQEFACRNGDCSDRVPMPPFRFFYKNEKESPLRHGEDFNGTVIASSNPQDEWGLWNKHATPDNHKVRQDFADYGGVSWSMDKVVDPAGGVLEIDYERDTYKGESYADDSKTFPISWRKCPTSNNLCIDVLPRRWEVFCNRNDQLEGHYKYRLEDPTPADYAYLADLYEEDGLTVKPNQQIYFQLDGNYRFEVGCGANIFGWKSHGCNRHRSVGTLGSGKVLGITSNTDVLVPFLDKLDANENGEPLSTADNVRTIELEVAFDMVDQTLKKAGEALTNRNNRTAVIPIKGIMWIRKVQSNLKGGDLRVKKLVRRDIGLVQTTRYEYATGEMAQYPDSVLSTAFAERFSPTKSIVVMPLTYLPGISRVPGINDQETSFLPGPTISYPKVTVTNISEDGNEVLNGKTVYEFIAPESGVPQRDGGALPFVKMRLVMQRKNSTEDWGGINVRFKNSANAYIGPTGTMSRLSGSRDNEFHFQNASSAAPYRDARYIEFTYAPMTGVVTKTIDLTEAGKLQSYSDLDVTAYFDATPATDIFDVAVAHVKSSASSPIIVRTSTHLDAFTFYRDYTSFLGMAKNTEYYRWIPSAPGERNDTRIPANATRYKLIKADTIIYSSVAPSGDDRFYTEGQNRRLQIGQDDEKWEYMRKVHCDDANMAVSNYGVPCDFGNKDAVYASYKGIEVTVNGLKVYTPKQMTYSRAPAFVVETITKSGFNNSTGPDEYLLTRLTNHRFDPITGQPTFAVTYNGRASQYVPAKATRMTPAYHVNTPLAATMFERNMLSSNFREDAYTWAVSVTPTDDNSGNLINFDTENLSSPNILPPRLTRVKITPFTQQYLDYRGTSGAPRPITAWDNPIVGMGEYSPRFKLTDAAGQAALANNATLFTPSFLDGTFLRSWNGVEISAINKYLKPLQKRDVYGIKSAHRYDPTGFHQIGVFGNAGYPETVLLTAEGRQGSFPDVSTVDAWRFTGGSPSVDRNFIRLTGNFTLSHSMDLEAGKTYVAEFQVHSSADRTCQAAFFTDAGGLGDAKTVNIKAGLSAYQVAFAPSGGYPSPPAAGVNRIRLACNDNVAGSVRVAYLRAYPENAETVSYLYDARGNMVQSVNEQNVSSYYEYDAFGSLAATRNDDGQLFSTHKKELTNVATP